MGLTPSGLFEAVRELSRVKIRIIVQKPRETVACLIICLNSCKNFPGREYAQNRQGCSLRNPSCGIGHWKFRAGRVERPTRVADSGDEGWSSGDYSRC